MENNFCIEFHKVNFSYSHHQVLEDISFGVAKGDYVGLVGANGSGKTTMLRLMLGLMRPESGSVSLFGESIESFRSWHRIGYVPQHVSRGEDLFSISVREVVESGLLSKKKNAIESGKAIQSAMEATEIVEFRDRLLGELSGGERQLVFIARALVTNPEILVLDEPTTGVDAQSQGRFYSILSELNAKRGMTIVLVSHDLEVVAREVKTVICVNRTLVCHVDNRSFVEGNYLDRIYGEGMKYIHHEHNHNHA